MEMKPYRCSQPGRKGPCTRLHSQMCQGKFRLHRCFHSRDLCPA
uniref:Uncharacterized protein n=1 Tax=Echeneis naucrates TaxID=173247 RepID=A0A665WXG2_ECHNA